MINKDRIVPVTKTDLLTLYFTVLRLTADVGIPQALDADDADGNFTLPDTAGATFIASEPVKTFSGVLGENTIVYFIPAYGCTIEGVDEESADLYVYNAEGAKNITGRA